MKFRKIFLWVILSIVLCLGILFLILDSYIRVELDELNGKGEHQATFFSPSEGYKADVYQINEGGATQGYQDRVSITSMKDNHKEFNDETVYWLYPSEEDVSVEWKDDNEITINGQTIAIKDKKTYYNWKKDK
ncbi:DUF5412 family protein [Metabacillus litoralis]|uniref:DUF5412 family protein n=1 Tax=Metabacillus litoralis TaxID=152268 RepID=UPI001CFC96CC|nr:DUF5412 family protein [Metabacillus litoralis]